MKISELGINQTEPKNRRISNIQLRKFQIDLSVPCAFPVDSVVKVFSKKYFK